MSSIAFEKFREVLVRLVLQAYRRSSASPDNKLRGLFTHMYKVVNRRENGAKAAWLRSSDSSCVKQRAGSLNIFGTGIFNERFLDMWTADSFQNYVVESAQESEEGAVVLGRIIDDNAIMAINNTVTPAIILVSHATRVAVRLSRSFCS